MAKFMFIVPPFMGHMGATLSIGSELIAKGHTVAWVSAVALPERLIPKGGECIVPKKELTGKEKVLEQMLEKVNEGKSRAPLESVKFIYEDVLVPMNRYMVPGVSRILDDYKPDIVINDLQAFSGAICAYRKKIPYATSITTPVGVFEALGLHKVTQWEAKQVIDLQKEFGIQEEKKIINSPDLNLVYCPLDFTNPSNLPDNYHFVGPALKNRPSGTGFDWDALTKSKYPKIMISLGSLLKGERKEFFTKIIEAFGGKPYTIVAVVEKDLFPEWPANFIVQLPAPILELLPRMDAVISHAGPNTVLETLFFGLPLVVIPMLYDQYHIASQVEYTGTGVRLMNKKLKAAYLQEALRNILSENKYKEAAQKMRAILVAAGGTEKAVDLLEKFVAKSKDIQ
jgi:MGT family glycosyltransferase